MDLKKIERETFQNNSKSIIDQIGNNDIEFC